MSPITAMLFQPYLKGKPGETYNIGGNNEIKNIDIILTICKIMDEIKPSKTNQSYSKLITYVADRPGTILDMRLMQLRLRMKLTGYQKKVLILELEKQ